MRVWRGFSSVKFDGIGETVDSKISLIARAIVFVFPLACKIRAAEPATSGAEKALRSQQAVYRRTKQCTNWPY